MKKILVLVTVLALVAALVVPMAVSASPPTSSGPTVISGNVVATIEVAAPGNFSLGDITPPATVTSTDQKGTVAATGPWTMTVKDLDTVNPGQMVMGTTPLIDKMNISKDNSTFAAADAGITYIGVQQDVTNFDFYAQQKAEYLDKVGIGYQITITFAAGLN